MPYSFVVSDNSSLRIDMGTIGMDGIKAKLDNVDPSSRLVDCHRIPLHIATLHIAELLLVRSFAHKQSLHHVYEKAATW